MESFLFDFLAFEADSRYAGTGSFHSLASLRKVLKGKIEAARIERLQQQELTNEQTESTILRAWDGGLLELACCAR